jgi:hypothetical protein
MTGLAQRATHAGSLDEVLHLLREFNQLQATDGGGAGGAAPPLLAAPVAVADLPGASALQPQAVTLLQVALAGAPAAWEAQPRLQQGGAAILHRERLAPRAGGFAGRGLGMRSAYGGKSG